MHSVDNIVADTEAPGPGRKWPAAWRECYKRKSPRFQPERRVIFDLHRKQNQNTNVNLKQQQQLLTMFKIQEL